MTDEIVGVLRNARKAVDAARSLKGSGFWRAVSEVKHDPSLLEVFGDEISAIDRKHFENSVKLRVPIGIGIGVLVAGTLFGLGAIVFASNSSGLVMIVSFLVGFGALDVCTHSLAHWVVGGLQGMRFTHVFVGGPPPPRPGVKVDYASYLRTPARKRAVMHASGAVVTKLVPFALIPVAVAIDMPDWILWLLVVSGLFQITTDILFSTKSSDWMKVRRELKAARS